MQQQQQQSATPASGGLSLNLDFVDEDADVLYDNNNNRTANGLSKMRYHHSERQTSIEKIVNDVLIPPLSDSSPKFEATSSDGIENGCNSSGAHSGNLHSVSPPLEVSDIDLSNISPLSSLQQQQQHLPATTTISHPYFSTLNDSKASSGEAADRSACILEPNTSSSTGNGVEKMKGGLAPINISNANRSHKVHRIYYSNTPNILSSGYRDDYMHHKMGSTADMVKDDLYYLEYGHRNLRSGHVPSRHSKYSQFQFQSLSPQQQQPGPTAPQLPQQQQQQQQQQPQPPQEQEQQAQRQRRRRRRRRLEQQQHRQFSQQHGQSHAHQQQMKDPQVHPHGSGGTASLTSPLTPHSVHTARTALNSPHSVQSSHTPHTPHSMNHAFPRFAPYSGHNNPQSAMSTASSSQYSWNQQKSPLAGAATAAASTPAPGTGSIQDAVEDRQAESSKQQAGGACAGAGGSDEDTELPQQPPAPEVAVAVAVAVPTAPRVMKPAGGSNPTSSSSFLNSGPRMNYTEEGLSAADVQEVLSQLEIRPDALRDSSTDFRPVFSCIRPIVCHKSNTPFYAQCSTAKLGYCTWCRQLRRGNQKQGSICLNCGERLTAKYHRWYPHLVRLEPLEKTRTKSMYLRYKPVFERFGITWHNDKQFDFVIDHYMLMKIYLSTENFNIEPLHLERTYMIGVFAGREFNTGALARKLLREGTKLAMFRADFPDYYDFLRDERAAVAEQMNLRFFQGIYKCYFHAHYTNIEGWYDPSVISRESIIETFKELCNTILAHTALAHINQNSHNGGGKGKQANKRSVNSSNTSNSNSNNTNSNAHGSNTSRNRNSRNNQHQHQHHYHHHHQQPQHHRNRHPHSQSGRNNGGNAGNGNGNGNSNANLLSLSHPNQMMNVIHNGLNMAIRSVFGGTNATGNSHHNHNHNHNHNQHHHQHHQHHHHNNNNNNNNNNNTSKNNQLLAATQSMLNGISAMPAINQLSVTNMAAITPIGKVKSFQFNGASVGNSSVNVNVNALSPAYLPPLATTPRFTVPTPRSGVQQYHAINLGNMNNLNISNASSPLQIPPNGSNPPSVSMLSATNLAAAAAAAAAAAGPSLQIPTSSSSSMLKNTNSSASSSSKKANDVAGKGESGKDTSTAATNMSGNASASTSSSRSTAQGGCKKGSNSAQSGGKNSLNAGAAPFLLNAPTVISPPISPRNFNRTRFVAPPPPPPQSFAFPPPPLPHTTNWLPVPPVLAAAATTPTSAALTMHHAHHAQQPQAIHMMPSAFNPHSSLTPISMHSMHNAGLPTKDLTAINHQNHMNVSLVHNRGSPLFTPTQSPQFRPFSH